MTNWINPFRKEIIGELWIMYTRKEGEEFKVFGGINNKDTKKIFNEAIKNGYIQIKTGHFEPPKIKLAFIGLVSIKDNWDFVIEKINKVNKICNFCKEDKLKEVEDQLVTGDHTCCGDEAGTKKKCRRKGHIIYICSGKHVGGEPLIFKHNLVENGVTSG